ncbi:PH domain-containing protein [Variovorax arabinosiphilus]|uniref:PH domain-containing protein n=1 Tax=Variovorax arabinosiphilus TaxID=3053498 RepID=UPI002578EFC3|nr:MULTISPECIES: PH domain-containing protein [unclassified Variovorax]MDM0121969.1 PH domain-containing protein [Variovorax sp. J2L1-78]MDM0131501.1 PH domain-containing protein [Variovorax sp. J2L1-63]MDM0234732.1 PH domain-containing protein [Variovorax sp. J2R1-6]
MATTVQSQPSNQEVAEDLVFFSRIDVWLVLCVGASLALCFVLAWTQQSVMAFAIGSLTVAAVLALTVPCKYTLTKSHLKIRCGLLKRVVPYADIVGIELSRSIVSAPALSLMRVKVSCARTAHLISPNDRERFMKELRARAPLHVEKSGIHS